MKTVLKTYKVSELVKGFEYNELLERLKTAKAEAWEEGYTTGLTEESDKVTFNPYGYAQHPYRQEETE